MNYFSMLCRPVLYGALAMFLVMNLLNLFAGSVTSLMAIVVQTALLYALYARARWLYFALSAWSAVVCLGCAARLMAAMLRGAWIHGSYDLMMTLVLFIVAAMAWVGRSHIVSAESAWPRPGREHVSLEKNSK